MLPDFSQSFTRLCLSASDLTHSQNQQASHIPYPKEMCPFNSCLSQLSEICFIFWKKNHVLLIDPFLRGLTGWHWAGLLQGGLVHYLVLVHLTAWVGVQYLIAFPVIYPKGRGPEPLGLISSVLGEAEAEDSHSACALDMPDQWSPSHPSRPGFPWEIVYPPLPSWLTSLMPPQPSTSYPLPSIISFPVYLRTSTASSVMFWTIPWVKTPTPWGKDCI